MKKVLALVLVTIMAFGMIVPATAANPKPASLNTNLGSGYGLNAEYFGWEVVTLRGTGANSTNIIGYSLRAVASGKAAWDGNQADGTFGTVTYTNDVVPHDEVDDFINLYVGMFNWENGYPVYANKTDGIYWDTTKYGTAYPYSSVLGQTYLGEVTNNVWGLATGTTGYLVYNVGGVYYPVLSYNQVNLAAKEIREGKIGVRTSVSAGSKAIDNVSIDTKAGIIKIAYVDEYVSTKALDFEFTVYLTFNNKRATDQGLTFVGTLANPITEVYEDDDYVDTSNGAIAHALEFVKAIEVDLGNGVSIHTKFFKDKKYYGTSTRDADEEDDVVFAKYPDVDNVVTLKTVGLNSTGDIVKLDTDYSDYYVYDVNMNYLGQSNEMLPYSTKYYLANRKLDVDTVPDEVDDGSAPVVEGENPDMGGDDIAASNPNANPGTGR